MSYQRASFASLGFLALSAALTGCSAGAPVGPEDAGAVDAADPLVEADAGAFVAVDAGALDVDAGALDADGDRDGLADDRELALATAYLPFLSTHPDDACPRSGLVFRARPHPLDASFVHVIYSRLYELDCGFTSHAGDNEVFSLTIDPTRPPPAGIVAVRAISHQNTICQRDTACGSCAGLDACDTGDIGGLAFPVVYASKDKHAGVVDVGEGCSLVGSCLDRCQLAPASTAVPLVNAGEPNAPLVDDLSDPAQGGFITEANGWREPSVLGYDPWSGSEFGSAGVVSEDLVDLAFDTPVCRPDSGVVDPPVDSGEPFVAAPDFVPVGPLCDAPVNASDVVDPVHLPCAIEVDNRIAPPRDSDATSLRVVAWNVRFGAEHAAVLDTLRSDPVLASADVLLLSEVARGDGESVPAGLEQARALAIELGMNYAFAVEWDRRFNEGVPAPKGEHGVAVLARFPIGHVTPIRHTPANDWWDEQQDLGGRITLGATLLTSSPGANARTARVYASHLCTRPNPIPNDDPRALQGAEIRADAALPGRPSLQVIGGDLNTWTCNPAVGDCTSAPDAEDVVIDLLDEGWLDGTAGYNGRTQIGAGFFPQRLDWLFYRGASAVVGTALLDVEGSDHLPLFFDVTLP